MNTLKFTILFSLFSFYLQATVLPSNYKAKTGCEKQEWLWSKVLETRHSELPPLVGVGALDIAKMSFQRLIKKVDRTSDVSPEGWAKYIHKRGIVAKVKYVPESGHPFTGMFKSESCGILRASITGRPGRRMAFAPGLALKLLRDRENVSANISLLYTIMGQGKNYNFMANPLSNIVVKGNSFGSGLIRDIFLRYSPYPEELKVDHFAIQEKEGLRVVNWVTPRQIFFVPTGEVNFPKEGHEFRASFMSVPEGTTLYEIRAASGEYVNFNYNNFTENMIPKLVEKSILIGKVITTSKFIASEFGDQGIFFNHEIVKESRN